MDEDAPSACKQHKADLRGPTTMKGTGSTEKGETMRPLEPAVASKYHSCYRADLNDRWR